MARKKNMTDAAEVQQGFTRFLADTYLEGSVPDGDIATGGYCSSKTRSTVHQEGPQNRGGMIQFMTVLVAALMIACLSIGDTTHRVNAETWITLDHPYVKFLPPAGWNTVVTPDRDWVVFTSPNKDAALMATTFTQACESTDRVDKTASALGITNIKWNPNRTKGTLGKDKFVSKMGSGSCDFQGSGGAIWSAKVNGGAGENHTILFVYAVTAKAPPARMTEANATIDSLQRRPAVDPAQPIAVTKDSNELARRLSAPVQLDARFAETKDHWITLEHPCMKFLPPSGWTTTIAADGQWGAVMSPNKNAALTITVFDASKAGEATARLNKATTTLSITDIQWKPEHVDPIGKAKVWAKIRDGLGKISPSPYFHGEFRGSGSYIGYVHASEGSKTVPPATPSSAPVWVDGPDNIMIVWAVAASAPKSLQKEVQAAIDSLQWR